MSGEMSLEQKQGMQRRRAFWLPAVIMALIIFIAGFLGGYLTAGHQEEELAAIRTAKKWIDKYYYKDYDAATMTETAVAGMIAGLKDPYSYYLTEQEQEDFTTDTTGQYVGIGVTFTPDEENLSIRVIAVRENGPAAQAGLQAGDVIRKVNGTAYTYEQIEDVLKHTRGNPGEKVTVEVERAGAEPFSAEITKGVIDTDSVEGETLADNIAYLRILSFDMTTYDEVLETLKELQSTRANGLIIDLRNNVGGVVEAATDIVDAFLEEGRIVTLQCKGETAEVYEATGGVLNIKTPIVILMNQYTASASEIMASSLREHGKAVLVGTKTYGKGVVNRKFPVTDTTGMVLTVGEYYTPNGVNIHGKGIQPDVEVLMSQELTVNLGNLETYQDVQLLEAINQVKKAR